MGAIYSRYRPPKIRIAQGELADHKYGYTRRRLTEDPRGTVLYRAECTCNKWKDPHDEYVVYRVAYKRWQQHIDEVQKQQRLAV